MKNIMKIISRTVLITLLSAGWIAILPQLITSVHADTVNVSSFDELSAAFSNPPSNPTVIVLNNDIDYSDGKLQEFNNGNIELDLNGKNLNIREISVGGKLKIKGTGNIKSTHASSPLIEIGVASECIISGGTLTSQNKETIRSSGKLTISGGTVTSDSSVAVLVLYDVFKMTGGSLSAAQEAVYNNHVDAKFIMEGGRIDNGGNKAVNVKRGSFEMKGGTITSSATQTVQTEGTVTIKGGTISNSGNGKSIDIVTGKVTQTGGTITGPIDAGNQGGEFVYQGGINDDHVSVTFYKNDGSGDTSIQYVPKNTQTALTANSFNWDGHTFAGWSLTSTGDKRYDDGDTVELGSNTDLYALWTETPPPTTTYTVTTSDDGNGTCKASPTRAKKGVEITLSATAKRGYRFKEWEVVSGGITITNDKFRMPENDVTVKAIFEPVPSGEHTITVTNDGNGTARADKKSAAKGTAITLTSDPNENYRFKEWQVVSGDISIEADQFAMPDEDVEVKAIFEKKSTPIEKCVISFDPNGGKGEMKPQTGDKGDTVKLRANDFKRSGYEFKNWNTEADGSGDKYDNKQSVELKGDMTLYAQWKEKDDDDDDDDDDHEEESSPSNQNNTKVPDGCDELRAKLSAAISEAIASGKEKTVTWDKGTSLPYDVMKMLQDNPKITLEFSYTYQDQKYMVTIPGSRVIANPSIQWYGPVYLYALYGQNQKVTLPAQTSAATGTYTVKSGDTLSAIAKRLKSTIKHLKDANNIKDADKIKPGMVLKY